MLQQWDARESVVHLCSLLNNSKNRAIATFLPAAALPFAAMQPSLLLSQPAEQTSVAFGCHADKAGSEVNRVAWATLHLNMPLTFQLVLLLELGLIPRHL